MAVIHAEFDQRHQQKEKKRYEEMLLEGIIEFISTEAIWVPKALWV